jgi:hypothetical protein
VFGIPLPTGTIGKKNRFTHNFSTTVEKDKTPHSRWAENEAFAVVKPARWQSCGQIVSIGQVYQIKCRIAGLSLFDTLFHIYQTESLPLF